MTPFVPPSWLAWLLSRDRFLRVAIELLGRLIVVLYRLQRVPVWRSFDGRVTLVYMRAEVERRGLEVYPTAWAHGFTDPNRGARRFTPVRFDDGPGPWGDS